LYTKRDQKIKGLLLDVGGTIAYPKSGSWFIPCKFEEAFISNNRKVPSFEELYNSIPAGMEYLDSHFEATNIKEEIELFSQYYWHVLKKLLNNNPPAALCEQLSRMRVYETENFQFYTDVLPSITKLNINGLSIGIVSENWPSLITNLKKQGCIELFKTITISSVVKCRKSNRYIFDKAIEEIGIDPQFVLFVDDGEENVVAAIEIGMHGLHIRRKTTRPAGECKMVENMEGIEKYIEEMNE
jgi:HAD superfamily hydrolase (TIGR01509 family)